MKKEGEAERKNGSEVACGEKEKKSKKKGRKGSSVSISCMESLAGRHEEVNAQG